MSEVVTYEQAKAEVDAWLDGKKVKPKKRESYKDAVDNLIDGVMDGSLTIEDGKITQMLSFPVKNTAGGIEFDKLEYKPRLTVSETQAYTKTVKPGDSDGRIMAYASALTGKSAGLLGKLDTEDNGIVQSIAIFFV